MTREIRPQVQRAALDAALLQAHARGDLAGLVHLYAQAAGDAPDPDAAAFFLTHAYVYALETGDAVAPELHRRLVQMGRDVAGPQASGHVVTPAGALSWSVPVAPPRPAPAGSCAPEPRA